MSAASCIDHELVTSTIPTTVCYDNFAVESAPRSRTDSSFPPAAGFPEKDPTPLGKGSLASPRDLSLIRRVLAGDREAFYELIQPYQKAVFVAAFSVLKNEADAEEVAQEAILKALKNLAGFRQEAKFSTWLVQISINEARMKLRKDRRHLYESVEQGRRSEDGEYVPNDFADWREIPSEALEQKELRDALKQALESLPEMYRTVMILRDVQHLNIAETALALGLSEANVKTRLSRARLQMRDLLLPRLGETWMTRREHEVARSL